MGYVLALAGSLRIPQFSYGDTVNPLQVVVFSDEDGVNPCAAGGALRAPNSTKPLLDRIDYESYNLVDPGMAILGLELQQPGSAATHAGVCYNTLYYVGYHYPLYIRHTNVPETFPSAPSPIARPPTLAGRTPHRISFTAGTW